VLLHGAVFLALEGHVEQKFLTVLEFLLLTSMLIGRRSHDLRWRIATIDFSSTSCFVTGGSRAKGGCRHALCLAVSWLKLGVLGCFQRYPGRTFSVKRFETEAPAELWLEVRQESLELETPPNWNERRRFLDGQLLVADPH